MCRFKLGALKIPVIYFSFHFVLFLNLHPPPRKIGQIRVSFSFGQGYLGPLETSPWSHRPSSRNRSHRPRVRVRSQRPRPRAGSRRPRPLARSHGPSPRVWSHRPKLRVLSHRPITFLPQNPGLLLHSPGRLAPGVGQDVSFFFTLR